MHIEQDGEDDAWNSESNFCFAQLSPQKTLVLRIVIGDLAERFFKWTTPVKISELLGEMTLTKALGTHRISRGWDSRSLEEVVKVKMMMMQKELDRYT